MASDDARSSSYDLDDEQIALLASARPRFVPRAGKADIGGRMRVASIVRKTGLPSGLPTRIAGATNEVWASGDFIIRVGFTPGADRLRREARIAKVLPSSTRYPKVIASGLESFGEWMVLERLDGIPLSQAWPDLDDFDRRANVHALAHALRELHSMKLTPMQCEDLMFKEGTGALAFHHQFPVSRLYKMLDVIHEKGEVDVGLLRDIALKLRDVETSIGKREIVPFIHGDLHFENVLVNRGQYASMFDFEWARFGPPEIDIDMLARFCMHPDVHVGGDYPVKREQFRMVLRWMSEVYPELFERQNIDNRLMLVALSFEIPSLLNAPAWYQGNPLGNFHPVVRLRELLNVGTYAQRMDWRS